MSMLKLNEQDWLVYTNERGRDRNSSNADVLQAGEHAVEMVAALGCQMVVYGGRLGHECLILRRLGIEHAEGVTLVESAQSSKKKIKEKTIFFLPLHAVCRELAPHRPQVVDEHVSVRLPARAISERVDLELVQQAITRKNDLSSTSTTPPSPIASRKCDAMVIISMSATHPADPISSTPNWLNCGETCSVCIQTIDRHTHTCLKRPFCGRS